MDLLADVLTVAGVRSVLGARIDAAETWGTSWTRISGAAFYAVTAGTAWLGLPGRPPEQLMPVTSSAERYGLRDQDRRPRQSKIEWRHL
jgi:Cupin